MKKLNLGSLLFTLFLLLFVAVVVYQSFTFPIPAKLFPLMVAIPTLILLVLAVLSQWVPQLARESDVLNMDRVKIAQVTAEAEETAEHAPEYQPQTPGTARSRLISVSIMLISMGIVTYTVGFYIAMAACTLFFLKFGEHFSWLKAVIFAVGLTVFVWAMFGLAMRLELFEGVLFGGIA